MSVVGFDQGRLNGPPRMVRAAAEFGGYDGSSIDHLSRKSGTGIRQPLAEATGNPQQQQQQQQYHYHPHHHHHHGLAGMPLCGPENSSPLTLTGPCATPHATAGSTVFPYSASSSATTVAGLRAHRTLGPIVRRRPSALIKANANINPLYLWSPHFVNYRNKQRQKQPTEKKVWPQFLEDAFVDGEYIYIYIRFRSRGHS
jgi:hypothetical protein